MNTPITEIAFAFLHKQGHKVHKKSTACIPRINDNEHGLKKLHCSLVQTLIGSLSHIIKLLNFNTVKCLLRSLGTIQRLLMKCLPLEEDCLVFAAASWCNCQRV